MAFYVYVSIIINYNFIICNLEDIYHDWFLIMKETTKMLGLKFKAFHNETSKPFPRFPSLYLHDLWFFLKALWDL